jgi:CRP-like cAMP-binding protein
MTNTNQDFNILFNVLNLISPIDINIQNDIKKYFKQKVMTKNEYLFYMEDDVKDYYFLIEGLARYYYLTKEGKEFNKSFAYKKGHLLSSISSVIDDGNSPFCVEVLSDCFIVLYISYDDFRTLGYKYKQWHDLTIRIYEKLIIKKERREADFLLLNATQRYEKFFIEYEEIINKIPNYHIASYLGITEVALSRIRKELFLT